MSAGQLAVLRNVADKLEQEEVERYLLNVDHRLVVECSRNKRISAKRQQLPRATNGSGEPGLGASVSFRKCGFSESREVVI